MPTLSNKNATSIQSIHEYRKSVFVSDMYAGTFVVFLALFIIAIGRLENLFAYLLVISNLLLSLAIVFFLKKKKYILAVYTNLFFSILLVTLGIIAFGSIYNTQIFFISLSLSAFIYTANQRFNQFFFVVHILLFMGFSLFKTEPFFELEDTQANLLKIAIYILFSISFTYKGMLMFKLYIKSEAAIQKESLIYQTLFNNAYEGIISVHKDALSGIQYEIPNQQVFNLFDDSNFSIEYISNYFPKNQPDGTLSTQYFNQMLNSLKQTNRIEYNFAFLNKKKLPVYTKLTIVKLQDLFEKITIYLFKDISTEVKNQNTINSQLVELNAKNNQLTEYIQDSLQFENFAHLASHDLKTPTRTLISFSQLLERRNKHLLDDESTEFLNFIKNAAKKVNFIINDLSEYAKITTSKNVIQSISFHTFLDLILKVIKTLFTDVKLNVQLIDLPEKLQADEKKLKILFYNLLTNAVQFRQTESSSKIKIKYKEKAQVHQFAIEDNGIGIDKAYIKDIFLIFKKLNATDEANNTGIGLATCQKIVQLHQGEIWVESKLNKGSIFYFTISKNL